MGEETRLAEYKQAWEEDSDDAHGRAKSRRRIQSRVIRNESASSPPRSQLKKFGRHESHHHRPEARPHRADCRDQVDHQDVTLYMSRLSGQLLRPSVLLQPLSFPRQPSPQDTIADLVQLCELRPQAAKTLEDAGFHIEL
ncbi:hypothetical protein BV898_17973 [Hypsibius exemplaris]|uniref:Uncharacterized protein n=1 Tax=Hypsibius exemplaris TaxID=2072580 RepID=A0A9X6NG06_HYPEX|nr:hypothetical protein BV898_17973 [Hypsibius exemplaris]